jgi:carbamoyltransferase
MITLGYTGFTRDSSLFAGNRRPLAKTDLKFDNIFTFRDGEVPFTMFPLGYLGHDASATIIQDGRIIAGAAEERFIRAKHSLNLAGNTLLPINAIRYCLDTLDISIEDVDVVAHYCDFHEAVILKRFDLLQAFLSQEHAIKVRKSYLEIYQAMMKREVVIDQFKKMTGHTPRKFVTVKHHEAHAASAFFPSGFKEALILTIDGTGELESSLLAIGRGQSIQEIYRTLLPISLGSLYLIITVFLGFRSLGDEYKVMSLAAFGNPARFRAFFKTLVVLDRKGRYSTPWLSRSGFKELLIKHLGSPKNRDEPFNEIHADIAASLQESLKLAILHTLKYARNETGLSQLCMAGGVALNCLLTGEIARSRLFKKIFVQPASSDEGCSLGAALYADALDNEQKRSSKAIWGNAYLGPQYNSREIHQALEQYRERISWEQKAQIAKTTANEIASGKIVGWFQGRMEFGPRALGNRSILADPRNPSMKDRINAKVKHREKFQPFAPAVLEEEASRYFDLFDLQTSPFMLFAVPVWKSKQQKLAATTHIDGTARVQTVSRKANPLFWELIDAFNKITGVPVILNTSFNDRNEPIVCTPEDAIKCFFSTNLDVLVIGNYFIKKRILD